LTTEKPPSNRLVSLDAFRGFTIVSMLIVNNTGYDSAFSRQFRHAGWGEMVTFCDMIFPWFLFMVGVALPYSAASFRKNFSGCGFLSYLFKVFKRSFLLVFLGILIDCSIGKGIVIGMNVLQLIGLAYFCGALIYELPQKWRMGIAMTLLVLHWALIRFVPIPNVGAGFFEADKNIIAHINNILRPCHLAGIVSVAPTTALVLIGSLFGDMFRREDVPGSAKLKTLLLWGGVLIIMGLLWNLDLSFNKSVWSASYILFAGGMGCIVLSAFFYLIDMKGFHMWAFPFVAFGMNAITAYFFTIIVRVHTLQEWFTKTAAGEKITLWKAFLNFWTNLAGIMAGSWLFTGSYVFFWFLVMWWMYRKRLFLRI
jgi:predicted acyltransferase